MRHGPGMYVWKEKVTNEDGDDSMKDVARFEGLYSKGVKNGYGKMNFPNKDIYEGNFKDDKV